MDLLKALIEILELWRPAFCKEAAFVRAQTLVLASLCAFGRKTITSLAIFLGRGNKLPIADYKFYSECKWNVEDLFNPILQLGVTHVPGDYISVAADDTKIRKTGKKIPHAGWHADPMGPPFQTNLIWGIRYLQMSLLVPLYQDSGDTPCRALPIRFISAPSVKKPGKKATASEKEEYRKLAKEKNLSTIFVSEVKKLRKSMDEMGLWAKKLLMTCDGSFCNKTCMNIDDNRIIMLARARKDAKLCFQAPQGSRKVYDEKKFTPVQIRQDDSIPWRTGSFFYGNAWREMRYKEVPKVLWENGTKRKPLRLIVLAPIPYIRGMKRNYRDPAYLLTTGLDAPIEVLIQAYLDRWQIEYNHRDEKSIIGVGEAQVWNQVSVERQPPFHVAAYSALLMANILVYKDKDHEDFGLRPPWRKKPKRNTARALVGMLRASVLTCLDCFEALGVAFPGITKILRQAA